MAKRQTPVKQSGSVTPRHVAMWTTDGIIQDGGTPASPGLSGLGVQSDSAASIAINNAAVTDPYNRLGFGVTDTAAEISVEAFGGAADIPLNISASEINMVVNGNTYPFPGPSGPYLPLAGGTIAGPLFIEDTLDASFTKIGVVNADFYAGLYLRGLQSIPSGTVSGPFAPINIFQITESIAVPSGLGVGFWVQLNTGGPLATGGRVALQGSMEILTPTGNTGGQYVAVLGDFYGSNDETNGIGYGGNFTAQLKGGADFGTTGGIVGTEFNVGIQAGSAAGYIVGIQVVMFGNGTVPGGLGDDTAYMIGDQGGVGFDYGFRISGVGSQVPVKTTGTLFYTQTPGTVRNGFDVSSLNITDWAFKSSGVRIEGGAPGINYLTLSGGAGTSGSTAPTIYTQGASADINLNLSIQGLGNFFVYSGGGAHVMFQAAAITGSDSWITIIPAVSANAPMQIFGNAGAVNNILIGGESIGSGLVPTASTRGWLMVPFTSGVPTGVPANSLGGAAVSVNEVSKTLNIHVPGGGYYRVALTAGAG